MNATNLEQVFNQAVAYGSFAVHQTSLAVYQVSEIALSAIRFITHPIVSLSEFAITAIKRKFGYVPTKAPSSQVLVLRYSSPNNAQVERRSGILVHRPDLYALLAYYHHDRLPFNSHPASARAVADLQQRVCYYLQRNAHLASHAFLFAQRDFSQAIVIQDLKILHAQKEAEEALEALATAAFIAAVTVAFAVIGKDSNDKYVNGIALMAISVVFIAVSDSIVADRAAAPYSFSSDTAMSEAEASAARAAAALFASFAALAISSSLFSTFDASARSARAIAGIAGAFRDIFDLTHGVTPAQAISNRVSLALGWY